MMDNCKPNRPSRSLVGIIVVFAVAGACAGFAAGQLSTRAQATKEVESIRMAYNESQKVRGDALRMCLQIAPSAASSAATAATAAGEAAAAAQRALESKAKEPDPTHKATE